MTRRRPSLAFAVVALTLAALAAGCATSRTSPPAASVSSEPVSKPYRTDAPGLVSTLFLAAADPRPGGRIAVVVLIPGGGWEQADPDGLVPLARALSASGSAVVTTTYRTKDNGGAFPVPLNDVVCAIDDAVQRVSDEGLTPGPVVVVGHSAGAQLAAVAALVGEDYQQGCLSPPVSADGLVGLAGPYDLIAFPGLARKLFNDSLPDENPVAWKAANPMAQAAERPTLPVLLLHGEDDEIVSPDNADQFTDALRKAGHPVTLLLLPGVDHDEVIDPARAEVPIGDFVQTLLQGTT